MARVVHISQEAHARCGGRLQLVSFLEVLALRQVQRRRKLNQNKQACPVAFQHVTSDGTLLALSSAGHKFMRILSYRLLVIGQLEKVFAMQWPHSGARERYHSDPSGVPNAPVSVRAALNLGIPRQHRQILNHRRGCEAYPKQLPLPVVCKGCQLFSTSGKSKRRRVRSISSRIALPSGGFIVFNVKVENPSSMQTARKLFSNVGSSPLEVVEVERLQPCRAVSVLHAYGAGVGCPMTLVVDHSVRLDGNYTRNICFMKALSG